MDADLVQQIYPLVAHAKETIPNLSFEDQGALTADLYLGIAKYYNKEIPKYLDRLHRLEDLKKKDGKLKDQQFLDNLQKQQDSILEESKQKQNDLLGGIYSEWFKKLERVND